MSFDVAAWQSQLPEVVINGTAYPVQLPDRAEWRAVADLMHAAVTPTAAEFALRRLCAILGLPAVPILALAERERTALLRRLLDRVEGAYRHQRPSWWRRLTSAALGGAA